MRQNSPTQPDAPAQLGYFDEQVKALAQSSAARARSRSARRWPVS